MNKETFDYVAERVDALADSRIQHAGDKGCCAGMEGCSSSRFERRCYRCGNERPARRPRRAPDDDRRRDRLLARAGNRDAWRRRGCKRACSPTATQGGGCEVLRLRGMLCSHGDPREVRPHRTLIARNRSLPPSPINDHEPSMRKTGAAYLATRSPRCTGLLYPLSNYATPAVARHPCEQLPAHGRASERH